MKHRNLWQIVFCCLSQNYPMATYLPRAPLNLTLQLKQAVPSSSTSTLRIGSKNRGATGSRPESLRDMTGISPSYVMDDFRRTDIPFILTLTTVG